MASVHDLQYLPNSCNQGQYGSHIKQLYKTSKGNVKVILIKEVTILDMEINYPRKQNRPPEVTIIVKINQLLGHF